MSKSVIRNISRNITTTLINLLAPLVIIPILTSGLGVQGYGLYVILMAKAALFIVIFELGFGMYLSKEISINRDNKKEVTHLFWIFLLSKVVLFFVFLLFILLTENKFGSIELLFISLVLFQLLNLSPVLMGLEKYKLLNKIQIISKSLLIISVFISDFTTNGIEKALALQSISAFISIVLMYGHIFKGKEIAGFIFDFKKMLYVIKHSFPFYGARFFVNLYQQSSTYFISFILSLELVALYSIAIQLYKVGQSIIGAVSRVLYTSTVKTKDFTLIKKLTIKSLLIHFLLLPVIFFFGEDILGLIFDFDVVMLSELSLIFYISLLSVLLSSYWGYPALSAIGQEKYAHLGILVSSVTYFISLFCIYTFHFSDAKSAVYCIVIADFSGMLVRCYYAKKFKLI